MAEQGPGAQGEAGPPRDAATLQRQEQLRKTLELLEHASVCRDPNCGDQDGWQNCQEVRMMFTHGRECQVKLQGGCGRCRVVWGLLELHARHCQKTDNCPVPLCGGLRAQMRREREAAAAGGEPPSTPALATTPALAAAAAGVAEEDWRDWGNAFGEGLPAEVLAKVAEKLVALKEAAWVVHLKEHRSWMGEEAIQHMMAWRKSKGNCLFVFARVCKEWRKAQLKVGGPLRTRVHSDVLLPGRVALARWALAEGCPRKEGWHHINLAQVAATYGHTELVEWLCGEGGFAMDDGVMEYAAIGGNLELVQWLRGAGCRWDWRLCYIAVDRGNVEMLRWARENGAPWDAETWDRAAEKLGYTDDFGNLSREAHDQD